ncbi:OLC1v1004063C1 [Oldenlandia corymbosa var. corymbosa]|nr:OLC1v1004063C1 [Oldenlandia corymbosa var. corymbosa]
MSFPRYGDDSDDDWRELASEQHREITAAKELDSDLDFAFQLQLQEAINASLSLQPSSSSSVSTPQNDTKLPPPDDGVSVSITDFQSEELLKIEQEIKDRKLSEVEFKRIRDDLHRRIHDKKVAEEIHRMPDDDWDEYGDNFEKPFGGEGSSSGNSNRNGEVFRVYFKGLIEKEVEVKGHNSDKLRVHSGVFYGIGVAICDSRGELLFELAKPIYGNGLTRKVVEFKALLEGLNTALELDLKRVNFCCHYYPLYQYVTHRWTPKQQRIIPFINQVAQLQGKFASCRPILVTGNDVRFAFKLAREAIVAQVNKPSGSSGAGSSYETCVICLEDKLTSQMFTVDGCMHSYCYSCMKQHVEVKMLSGVIPKCPHESCASELKVESCSKFLTPKLLERLKLRFHEASIPVTERVYCPYPKCSALMSKAEALAYTKTKSHYPAGVRSGGATLCIKCKYMFCISCKVPWHNNMTCYEYERRNPYPPAGDMNLKNLAAVNLWRQCVKCNHMIELATGCYHMTCR